MQVESFLERAAARLPEKTALVCSGGRHRYAEVDRDSDRFAAALATHGVGRGDRVVVHLGNCAEAVLGVFATLKAGGVFVPVNPSTKPEKLAYILNDCRARALLTSPGWSGLPVPAPHLGPVVIAGPSACEGTLSLGDLLAEHDGAPRPPRRCIDVDLAALIYTSGSTGRPKGVMLTHLNMVSAATSITTYLGMRESDVVLGVLPLSFDYGLYQVLMSFLVGATVVLERSFAYPHAVLQTLARERVTGLPLVPTMAAMLLKMDLSRHDLSSLRYLTNTAAALPVEHVRRLRALLPHVAFFSMYGLTECKRVAYLPPDRIDDKPGSVGRAMPNVEAFVADDAGRPLPHGTVGELVVRGSNVMLGYWGDPEETAKRLRPGALPGERVLHTGDLFRADEEGFLYFVGRKDDIIKSRGEKVSPREVEDVLCGHPAVAEAAVVGAADPVLGEAVRAFVALRPGASATPQELLRHCAERLEDYMVPRAVEVRAALPRSDNGKVDRRRLSGGEP